jgi:TatD DNase family protein
MIDVHVHLDQFKQPLVIAKQTESAKIVTVSCTFLPSDFALCLSVLRSFNYIRFALGLHPSCAEKHEQEYELFKKYADSTSYIGEVGLDFSDEFVKTKDIQLRSLRIVLEAVRYRPRFITLHSRKAEEVLLEMLDAYEIKGAVFHWYTGPRDLIPAIIAKGHYFSVNMAMLSSKLGRDIIAHIPKNRVLTETDGPFVMIAGRQARPLNIAQVQTNLAQMWNCTANEVESHVRSNFKQIIGSMTSFKQNNSGEIQTPSDFT